MIRNLLVIQLRQIGDVVLTTPIPRLLKEGLPGCRVSFLTEPPSHKLLEGNPHIDRIFLNNRGGSIGESLSLARALRRERFDAVLDFMANPRSALLAFLSRAPIRISYPVRGRGLLYTHRVRPEDGYAVDYKKHLLGPLGIRGDWNRPEIFLGEEEKEEGRALRDALLEGGPSRLVTVDPSHRRPMRQWPAEHYGALCRRLEEALDARPAVLWGPGEEEVADAVVEASQGRARKAPPTTLRQMAALIAAADLHLGNCSAPRHIAVAVETPTFTILGSTSAGWTYPGREHTHTALELQCQPCNSSSCDRDFACLRDLGPEEVVTRLRAWVTETLGWSLP